MKAIERLSSRSNPRRFRTSSRKSVSADAFNSSIRASAWASSLLRRRTVGFESLGAVAGRAAAARWVRRGAAFRAAAPAFRRFAAPEAFALFFFFMRILLRPLLKACRDSPRQDSPFPISCHALDEPRADPIIGLCFWIPEQN